MSPKTAAYVAAIALAVVVAHQHVAAAGGVKSVARIGN
jgi:hypothetical protein